MNLCSYIWKPEQAFEEPNIIVDKYIDLWKKFLITRGDQKGSFSVFLSLFLKETHNSFPKIFLAGNFSANKRYISLCLKTT